MSLINLLEEIIKAGENATIPLDMDAWHCGTSCCACGDVAVFRDPDAGVYELVLLAERFSDDLDKECVAVFGDWWLAWSVYLESAYHRREGARNSHELTTEELEHPHLTTDHNDREILHDYVRLIITKVKEKTGE